MDFEGHEFHGGKYHSDFILFLLVINCSLNYLSRIMHKSWIFGLEMARTTYAYAFCIYSDVSAALPYFRHWNKLLRETEDVLSLKVF